MPNEIGGGPFREAADPNAQTLENMRKKIEAEGKHALLVPENIKEGDVLKEFAKLVKKILPEKITLYSIATGRLEFSKPKTDEYKSLVTSYLSTNTDYMWPPTIMVSNDDGAILRVETIKKAEGFGLKSSLEID